MDILDFAKSATRESSRSYIVTGYVTTLTAGSHRSWLTGHSIEGSSSEKAAVISGVPQGTVLGPLFFLVFINDLCDKIHVVSRTRLFADDCIVYRTIKDTADCKALQQDLATLESWERKWVMEFHPQKCMVQQYGVATTSYSFTRSKCPLYKESLQKLPAVSQICWTICNGRPWSQEGPNSSKLCSTKL